MVITIENILSIDVMNQTKIIAGEAGLQREVKWVNVTEVLDEISVLQEGELLLTTAFGLSEIPNLLEELIPYLVKRKLAGLAIQTGYYLDDIPPQLITQCNHYEFPLLELPKHIIFSELTKAITKRIINRQMEMLEYAQLIHNRLTRVILQNKGLTQVASELAELVHAPVRIFDTYFNLLTSASLSSTSEFTNPQLIEREYRLLKKTQLLNQNNTNLITVSAAFKGIPAQVLQPLVVGHELYGYISVLIEPGHIKEMDKVAIASAATISTIEFFKERAIWEAEERIKGDFIDDLLENNIKTEQTLVRRANYLGFDLNKAFVVLITALDDLPAIIQSNSEEQLQEINQRLFSLIRFVLQAYQHQAVLKRKNNRLVILLQVNSLHNKDEIQRIAELLKAAVKNEMKLSTSLGIGQSYTALPDTAKSFTEAEHALTIGARLRQTNAVLFYTELGAFTLFSPADNSKALQDYCRQTVTALIDYDHKHNSELLPTLEALFRCNGGIKEAAKELYIHRHTLKYRLNRIQEISGLNPENTQDQFKLQLGLVVARILSAI